MILLQAAAIGILIGGLFLLVMWIANRDAEKDDARKEEERDGNNDD